VNAGARRRGVVADFDADAGYGTITSTEGVPSGEPSWFFHCTAIADGTRRIDVGEPVSFSLRPGHRGRWEAADVTAG